MDKFMDIAIKEAENGIRQGHGGPFGSVIVKNGQIIGKGHNEVVKNQDPTCHGEMMAIHDACKNIGSFDLSGCELYTTAEPCPMCLGAILWSNIKKVYFGCNIVDTENIGFRDKVFYELNESGGKAKLLQELDRDACLKLFEEYQSIKEKTHY
ncbi:MAG TPA: nucleoside deaminase [Bacilli bacterium]|jgi:guanine deaminase|nr:nucleoside deaminase [Bacilli bacterium]